RRSQNFVFVLEVQIHRAVGHICAIRYVRDARHEKSLLCEHRYCGIQDALIFFGAPVSAGGGRKGSSFRGARIGFSHGRSPKISLILSEGKGRGGGRLADLDAKLSRKTPNEYSFTLSLGGELRNYTRHNQVGIPVLGTRVRTS